MTRLYCLALVALAIAVGAAPPRRLPNPQDLSTDLLLGGIYEHTAPSVSDTRLSSPSHPLLSLFPEHSGPNNMLQHGAEASSHRGTFSRPAAVVPDLGPSSSSGIDLDLYLGNSERQRELKRQRVEELKEAAQEYYGKDFESWPHASITRGRYALYISKVKKRALSAFQLYEKYLDLIKPFVPVEQRSKIWPLSKFKEWYNANPDNVEYMSTSKADAVDNQYRDIKQQVGIIEEALHKAKSL